MWVHWLVFLGGSINDGIREIYVMFVTVVYFVIHKVFPSIVIVIVVVIIIIRFFIPSYDTPVVIFYLFYYSFCSLK